MQTINPLYDLLGKISMIGDPEAIAHIAKTLETLTPEQAQAVSIFATIAVQNSERYERKHEAERDCYRRKVDPKTDAWAIEARRMWEESNNDDLLLSEVIRNAWH